MPNVYYADYLHLDKILGSQEPESQKFQVEAHDEMLFIIIHQAYELWFKQILHELNSVLNIANKEHIDDNSDDLGLIIHRLQRVNEIWKLLTNQIDVLETMSSQDFLEFRNFLTPASGFQSVQFKVIEAKLGLEMKQRHGGEYYKRTDVGGFPQADYERINQAESEPTLKQLVVKWLERAPILQDTSWDSKRFWVNYREAFLNSLNEYENKEQRLETFNQLFFQDGNGALTPKALQAALIITAYRQYPLFVQPYQLLTTLLEIDETISVFRYRHLMMVSRMIGIRVGTGGINKEGKNQEGYLQGALNRHRIFSEFAELATYLIERRNLPTLPKRISDSLLFDK
ncbi:MAG: tryptophan 2,3-dioxygenase family protein [Bacteroidia bacterium]